MLDFRKVIFALSVAGLGLVSTASAQITCTGTVTAASPTLRTEGLTEQLGAITLTACGGTTNTAAQVLTVTTNVPITNLFLTGTLTSQTDATAVLSAGGVIAKAQLVSSTVMQFTFAVPATTVVGGASTITISNIRVNASAVPVGTGLTAAVAGGSGLIINQTGSATAVAGFTNTSLGTTKLTGYDNVAVCAITSSFINAVATVAITENFLTALTATVDELNLEAAGGANAIASNPAGYAGAATETTATTVPGTVVGTHIAIVWGNLVPGVTYYMPAIVTNGALTLDLVPAANSGDSAALTNSVIGSGTSPGYYLGYGASGLSAVPITVGTGGTATVYYAVTADAQGGIDSTGAATTITGTNGGGAGGLFAVPALPALTQINLYEVLQTGTTTGATSPVTASVYLAGNTAPGYPQFVTPAAPTVLTAKTNNTLTASTGLLTSCNTTLIFPYVLTSSGYDTGIELGNAAPGASVTGNSLTTTAAGSCTMTAWGSAGFGATAIPSFALTNSPISIASGTVNAFTLSTALPAADPVFVGYMIANCNFQGAHGFGFVFGGANGATGGAGLSYGYLAPILTDVFNSAPGAENVPF